MEIGGDCGGEETGNTGVLTSSVTGTGKGTAGTLLGGPIGTGNLYLTNDEANGGVGVGAVTTF